MIHRQQLVTGWLGGDWQQSLTQPGEVDQVLGSADQLGAGDVGHRRGEGIPILVIDEGQTVIVGQVPVIKDETDRPRLRHLPPLSHVDRHRDKTGRASALPVSAAASSPVP